MNIKKETPILKNGFYVPSVKVGMMLQCFTYIPHENLIVCGYKQINSKDEKYCDLVKFNLNGNIIKRYEDERLFHCNDITYNPKTNELLIIPMTDPRRNNYIYKYDYAAMTKKSEFVYTNNSYLVGIAYDNVNDKYILVGAGNTKDSLGIIINNSEFKQEKSFIIQKNNRVFQSVEVYKNMIFIYFNHEIEIRDYDGNLISIYKFNTAGESEGICYIGNGEFLIGLLDNSSTSMMAISSKVMKFKVKEENKMVIGIDMGHTLRGTGTGAVGIKSETGLNRPLGDLIIKKLRQLGHTVIDCTVDEGTNSLAQICANANRQKVDLFVSLHFNSFDGSANGVEVLTYSANSKIANSYAQKICNEISKLGFKNRGIKYRPDLHVLNSTKSEALLIEAAFIDSKTDMDLYNEEKVANAIVFALTGQFVEEKPKKYWVITDYIPVGEYGFESKGFLAKYFSDIPGVYFRSNPTGIWAETCYLPLEKCNELKVRLGNLFWTIKEH